jgi:hypothetical protein
MATLGSVGLFAFPEPRNPAHPGIAGVSDVAPGAWTRGTGTTANEKGLTGVALVNPISASPVFAGSMYIHIAFSR